MIRRRCLVDKSFTDLVLVRKIGKNSVRALIVGINPRPAAHPRDTMRTECIDAYARATADDRTGPRPGGPGETAGWGIAATAGSGTCT